jgi:hypothetical protein
MLLITTSFAAAALIVLASVVEAVALQRRYGR